MTNKERWMSNLALMTSLLPFILVAGSLQLLPDRIEIPTLISAAEEAVTISKYGYLYLGIFGIVPAALVITARILKARSLVERNFTFMTVAALVLAVVFLFVCAYGMIYQIVKYDIDLLKTFDFYGGSVVLVSLVAGMLSSFFPKLKRNDILGLKNKYTMADNRVWVKVHHVAADVYMATFFAFALFSSMLSIWLDFRYGWVHLIIWIAVVLGLILWGRIYSRIVSKKIKAIRNA